MVMITPINGHILIEPLKYETFVSMGKDTYEEVGVVRANSIGSWLRGVRRGYKVFFDSWLAAKYPTGKGEEYFWLVRWEDVRAIEKADVQNEIPK